MDFMWPPHEPSLIRSFASTLPRRLDLEGDVSCEPWREGASNAVWRLDIGALRAVLKIGKLADWRRQSVEAAILRLLDGRGAPRFLDGGAAGDDLPWDWSVIERIEGDHVFALDVPTAAALGKALSALREMDFGALLRSTPWTEFVRIRIEEPLRNAGQVPSKIQDRFRSPLARLDGCGEVGRLLDEAPSGIVHGDLIPLNLVRTPDGSMCVLDWENPRAGSAAWDLASIRKTFRLEDGAWTALRDATDVLPGEAIDFADALQHLQVAAWRAETWWGRRIRTAGDSFLAELDAELDRAEALLEGIRFF